MAPKRASKKNAILLRYDASATHDREETYEESPLDKQCAAYMAALVRTQLQKQRLATVGKAKQEAARARGGHDEEDNAATVAEEGVVEEPHPVYVSTPTGSWQGHCRYHAQAQIRRRQTFGITNLALWLARPLQMPCPNARICRR